MTTTTHDTEQQRIDLDLQIANVQSALNGIEHQTQVVLANRRECLKRTGRAWRIDDLRREAAQERDDVERLDKIELTSDNQRFMRHRKRVRADKLTARIRAWEAQNEKLNELRERERVLETQLSELTRQVNELN